MEASHTALKHSAHTLDVAMCGGALCLVLRFSSSPEGVREDGNDPGSGVAGVEGQEREAEEAGGYSLHLRQGGG